MSLADLQRYELKYTVPHAWLDDMKAFIEPYCFMDAYSARCADGFYRVNSLYLDSPDLHFLRTRLDGANYRFNMRIRTYGDEPTYPWFAEIKHKTGDTIRKSRALIREGSLESVLFDPARPGEDSKLAEYRSKVLLYNVRPWVQTRYQRLAYFSHCDDYARVTFDRALEYAPQGSFDPLSALGNMVPSDDQELFDPGTDVILELKCYTAYVPMWMQDLIRCFGLRRRGFSKYTAGMLPTLRRQGIIDPDYFEIMHGD